MATAIKKNQMPGRTARVEFRLYQDTKDLYEQAASLNKKTLSTWAVDVLTKAAQEDIAAAQRTVVSLGEFEAFKAALEAPFPEAAAALLAEDSPWD